MLSAAKHLGWCVGANAGRFFAALRMTVVGDKARKTEIQQTA